MAENNGKKQWRENNGFTDDYYYHYWIIIIFMNHTSCALSFPLTSATKSSSESTNVQPALVLGSPRYTEPGGFFKSTAINSNKDKI